MTIDKTKLGEEYIIPCDEQEFYTFAGQKIREARHARNISKQQAADALGLDVEFIDAFENATLAIPVYHFFSLAKFMNWPSEFNDIQKRA